MFCTNLSCFFKFLGNGNDLKNGLSKRVHCNILVDSISLFSFRFSIMFRCFCSFVCFEEPNHLPCVVNLTFKWMFFQLIAMIKLIFYSRDASKEPAE